MKKSNKNLLSIAIVCLLGLPLSAQADRTTAYTYNTLGLVETVDGPRVDVTDVTTYDYDTQGNRISITNPVSIPRQSRGL